MDPDQSVPIDLGLHCARKASKTFQQTPKAESSVVIGVLRVKCLLLH